MELSTQLPYLLVFLLDPLRHRPPAFPKPFRLPVIAGVSFSDSTPADPGHAAFTALDRYYSDNPTTGQASFPTSLIAYRVTDCGASRRPAQFS